MKSTKPKLPDMYTAPFSSFSPHSWERCRLPVIFHCHKSTRTDQAEGQKEGLQILKFSILKRR